MKVVLPDNSELELPAGATGLDAARAIGPKLAEQAVLVRSNGRVQDLRLPLADGQPIQILTTRDKDDPDALAVLRHSSAHLLAEADQGDQADEPRRRVLARRRAQQAADADLRDGVLFEGGPRPVPRAARGGPPARPPPDRPATRPVPLQRTLAWVGVLAPERDGD